MIKKSINETELIQGMKDALESGQQKQATLDLDKAIDYLHSAIDIFEQTGQTVKADAVLLILEKIAKKHGKKPKDPRKISDRHTKGLTSEKMVENLKHHGIVFNLNDDGLAADDLLNADIIDEPLEVQEKKEDLDFEDEI